MGTQYKEKHGFTIIEVILFLAVSSLLTMGVFASSIAGINNQRYMDGVNSFKTLVQEQFVNTTRVINNRESPPPVTCGATSNERGTSDCIIVGKLVNVTGAKNIVIADVAANSAISTASGTDLASLRLYTLSVLDDGQESSVLEWGTSARPIDSSSSDFAILILRSPVSGSVLVFVNKTKTLSNLGGTNSQKINEFIATATNTTDVSLCVEPEGLTIVQRQAVTLRARAASPAGVEQATNVAGCV